MHLTWEQWASPLARFDIPERGDFLSRAVFLPHPGSPFPSADLPRPVASPAFPSGDVLPHRPAPTTPDFDLAGQALQQMVLGRRVTRQLTVTALVDGSSGGGGATSVSNSDGTLTISPTTGSVVASLALGHANTWTGMQTFSSTAPAAPSTGTNSEAWGSGSSTAGDNSLALGNGAACGDSANGASSVVVGAGAFTDASSDNCVVVGKGANAQFSRLTVAIGSGANCVGNGAVAVGWNASANSGGGSVAIGVNANVTGNSAVGIGPSVAVAATNGVCIGNGNTFTVGSLALGVINTVAGVYSSALGFGNTVTHDAVVALGAELISERHREFIIGADAQNGVDASKIGHRIRVKSIDSSNAIQNMGNIDFTWSVATSASRTAQCDIEVYDFNGGPRIGVSVGTDGTNPLVGFLATAPVAQQTAGGVTAGFTPHTSANPTFNESTFTGNSGSSAYTISDIVAALKAYGLLAS